MTAIVSPPRHAVPQPDRKARPIPLRGALARPSTSAAVVAIACLLLATQLSDRFWDPHYLLFIRSGEYIEFGLLALTMTLLIVMGDIDLSVASVAGLCASFAADVYLHGLPIALAAVLAVLLGAACGLVNGFFVTRLALPSLVVTLATMALFRGIAQLLLRPETVVMPDGFKEVDKYGFTGTNVDVPVLLVVFLAIGIAFSVLLHRTAFGQLALTIGANRDAARYSGVRVDRMRITGFVLSGTMAAVVGLLFASQVGAVSYQAATGYELVAITVVVLGGTDIFGGRGSMPATMIALLSVLALREAFRLRSWSGGQTDAVLGGLLILSVLVPVLARRVASASRRRARTHRTPVPSRSVDQSPTEGAQ